MTDPDGIVIHVNGGSVPVDRLKKIEVCVGSRDRDVINRIEIGLLEKENDNV